MLDKIANTNQARLPEEEKIQIQVDLLNTLTANHKYSFESNMNSKNKEQASWYSENKSKTTS